MQEKTQTVVVLGASENRHRYSYLAQTQLRDYGHRIIPVTSDGRMVNGVQSVSDFDQIHEPVDTVSLYVRPEILSTYMPSLLRLNPKRVIFNPGTEDPALAAQLNQCGIDTEFACTLVLLSTGQFAIE